MLHVEACSPAPDSVGLSYNCHQVQDFLDLANDDVVDLDYVDEAAWQQL